MSKLTVADLPLILLGAGGHAKVLLALTLAAGRAVIGVCDPRLVESGERHWRGLTVLGGDDVLANIDARSHGLINGIGQMPGQTARRRVYEAWRARGFCFPPLVHPSAWVAPGVVLADGVQVMAGAVVQPDSRIGANSVVNTHASIDHDCQVGNHVHIAPGATLCGGVVLDDSVYIGAGATVIQGIRIGAAAVVGAGVSIVREVPGGEVVIGAAVRKPGK